MIMRAAPLLFGLFLLLPAAACADGVVAGYPGAGSSGSTEASVEPVPYPGAGYIDEEGRTVPYPPSPKTTPRPRPVPPTAPANPSVVCTQDAKICPNGKAVTRTGPHCAFAPCD